MTDHALLSASGASRWLACPPSARLEENFPDKGSTYAAEGTLAHEVCELKLRNYAIEPMSKRTFNSRYKKLKENELWADEMDSHTDSYLEYIKKIALGYKTAPAIVAEKRVDFSRYVPGGFGTADCLILAGDTLHVIDFKYGKGVEVSAENNPQMKLYALGALIDYSMLYMFKSVKMAIVQPRLGNISEYEMSTDSLIDWATMTVAPAAKLAAEGRGDFKAGAHCRFCRARAQCKARADACMEYLGDAASLQQKKKNDNPLPGLYSAKELGKYLKAGAIIKQWYEDISAYALSLCLDGQEVDGFKAVEGRKVRAFTDMEAAFAKLRSAGFDEAVLYNKVPLTLAQAEKLVGKKEFEELVSDFIVKNPGKPTLVPETDRRDKITNVISAAGVFEKLED